VADRRNDVRRAVHVVVSGRVQGVGYRDWTRREAIARSLGGWVRNRSDGTVEVVLAGEDSAVESMLLALRVGPSAARVKQVVTEEWTELVPLDFEVRETM
jgi:acylphosphatase